MKRFLLTVLAVAILAGPAAAVDPREILPDPVLETRAREIGKELRCLVCQNQSIDDSDADLARDLRLIVRERLVAGDSDQQVMEYVTSRYGDFVLLKPPVKVATYVLWFGPLAVFAAALIGVVVFYRRGMAGADPVPAPLSDTERQELDALVKETFHR